MNLQQILDLMRELAPEEAKQLARTMQERAHAKYGILNAKRLEVDAMKVYVDTEMNKK